MTYKELAKRAGKPKAIRAAASACGKNPIVILIPCHRVVASGGGMGGYSGGIKKKRLLLKHEKVPTFREAASQSKAARTEAHR